MATKGAGAAGAGTIAEVDAYIAKAGAFAQPILRELRAVMHEGAPGAVEAMKWSRPFFLYEGIILGNISAFKAHCSFGLWGPDSADQLKADGITPNEGMGSFGKIGSMDDLPPRKQLVGYVKAAAKKIATGERTTSLARRPASSRPKVAKPEAAVPEALVAALKRDKAAGQRFETMAPSCRREYCQWIAEARQEATRERRAAQAVAWIAEGKNRNWKYESGAVRSAAS